MMDFYKDAKSLEERAHQDLEKNRRNAEEKEARLVALRAMGDTANPDDLRLAKDLFKSATAAVVRAEERYERAAASTSRILENMSTPASTSSGSRARIDAEAPQESDKKGKKRAALEDLPREIKPPAGGWFDKNGAVHRSHALSCEIINDRIDKAWVVADAINKVQALCSSSSATASSSTSVVPTGNFGVDDTNLISTGLTFLASALTDITTLIYVFSEDGKKLHVAHKCGASVARFFEEDDPLRQGADGDRLKRAMKAAKQDEEKKKKSSNSGAGFSRNSNRTSGETRSGGFSDRRPPRRSSSFDYRDRGRDRGGEFDRKCFICGGRHLANECHKRRK